jgi:hypothetical protein
MSPSPTGPDLDTRVARIEILLERAIALARGNRILRPWIDKLLNGDG